MTPTAQATSLQQTKRTRIDSATVPMATLPLAQAAGTLASMTVSLHAPIQVHCKAAAELYIQAHHKLTERSASAVKLSNPDHLPQSIRFKYALKTNITAVAETTAYKKLQTDTEDLISELQKALKVRMHSVAELEMQVLKGEKSKTAFELLVFLSQSCAVIHLPDKDTPDNVKKLMSLTMSMESVQRTLSGYTAAAIEDMLTRVTENASATLLTTTEHHNAVAKEIYTTFVNLTEAPTNAYDAALARNAQAVELSFIARLGFAEPATSDAIMELDKESSVTPAVLESLIISHVHKALREASSKTRHPKRNRGAASTAPSASSNKKKVTIAPQSTPAQGPPKSILKNSIPEKGKKAKAKKAAAAAASANAAATATAANEPSKNARRKSRQKK